LLALTAILALTACPQKTAVWVAPESTAHRLRFLIADRRGGTKRVAIGVFRVDRCGASPQGATAPPMWGAGGIAGTDTVSVIQYGVMPSGFAKLRGQADTALTLLPGCYEAEISGTGRATFDVSADGRVRERDVSSMSDGSAREPSNVSLQLTGDCIREVVVAARLAPHVCNLHLPGCDIARS
jgi:hypothetical protein